MAQPMIGIQVSDRPFVPLLPLGSTARKRIVLSGGQNARTAVPLILRRSETKTDLDEKIGEFEIVIPSGTKSARKSVVIEIGFEKERLLVVTVLYADMNEPNVLTFRIANTRTRQSRTLPYGTFVYPEKIETAVPEQPPTDVPPAEAEESSAEAMPAENTLPGKPPVFENAIPPAAGQSAVPKDAIHPAAGQSAGQSAVPENVPEPEPARTPEDDYYTLADSTPKSKYRISAKLIGIISLIVVSALGLITMLVSHYVTNDVRISAEENNLAINRRTAAEAETRLQSIVTNVRTLLDITGRDGASAVPPEQAAVLFFERNQDIAAVAGTQQDVLINAVFAGIGKLTPTDVSAFLTGEKDRLAQAAAGTTALLNVSPYFSTPLIALLLPDPRDGEQHALVILFSPETLSETFGISSTNSSYLVNNEGRVIAHPDADLVLKAADLSAIPIVREMRENSYENRQLLYDDAAGESFFGAYRKLPAFADAGVITVVQASIVFESVKATTRRNIYLTIAVLAVSVAVIWFFSKTISTPVKALAAAAQEIKEGKFELNLKPHTKDELGLLTESFVSMGKGLAERERLKDTFGRFINKDIAEKAMRGELSLGGETKLTTIFFSDIRSFTAISEKLEPAEVVEFLNEYMTRMVDCVNRTGGVVDKFIGDAVMAVWGAPVSSGSPERDALNCVRTALLMRSALIEFNKNRGGDKNPIIRIGCGINTGPVVAGQIGSTERMEYTVIGDAVNFASRTESLNKPLGTDILITENTYELIKDHILAEQMPAVTVKGKEQPVRIYAVVNMPEARDIPGAGADGPQSVREIRALLGIPEPNLNGVNLDEEEKKYQIQGK